MTTVTSSVVDQGYAWVVLACCFGVQFIVGGVAMAGGVFVVEFRDAFGVSPGEASWVTAINTGIAFGCCECLIEYSKRTSE